MIELYTGFPLFPGIYPGGPGTGETGLDKDGKGKVPLTLARHPPKRPAPGEGLSYLKESLYNNISDMMQGNETPEQQEQLSMETMNNCQVLKEHFFYLNAPRIPPSLVSL